jgi:hypothetical protein
MTAVNEAVSQQTGGDAVRSLVACWNSGDPWAYNPEQVAELQIIALRERFEERRAQLKVVEQRAADRGIDKLKTLDDAVPLLFSHTTYKSYPASFLAKGKWGMMTRWLGTLSTYSTLNVDLSNVTDIESWINALQAAGHLVFTSSGTTGTSSFLNQVGADREGLRLNYKRANEVAHGATAANQFPYFWCGPRLGRTIGGEGSRAAAELYATPGRDFYITERDLAVAEMDRLAFLRKAIIDGTATADQIATGKNESDERANVMEGHIQRFLDKLFDHWSEPLFLFGGASMLWRIVEAGRSRGIPDGSLNEGSVIKTAGGLKGFRGGPDFYPDAEKFFGIPHSRWVHSYGMSEMISQFIRCVKGRYHYPASVIPFVLEKSGEAIAKRDGNIVTGRGGFFDLVINGRWGGVISGDRLTVDFGPCKCGRKSPSILEIARYANLEEGDEKLSCAGQIDSYVRGVTGGDWQ